jgi:integrase
VKGSKRYRSGAWRLKVNAGRDPVTGKRREVYETVKAPDNRAGAKLADARLAELVSAIEAGHDPEANHRRRSTAGITVAALAERWEEANAPRQNARTGDWIGWSPKTAKTHRNNFEQYILPSIGRLSAWSITSLDLDDLYRELERDRGLAPSVVVRCHSQIRAMYNWALRKKLVSANPTLAADPPKLKRTALTVPEMTDVRKVAGRAKPSFAAYVQLAATVGARRGTLVALRWKNVDLKKGSLIFEHAIAESENGLIEKGTKADRPYVVSLGASTVAVLTDYRKKCIDAALAVGVKFGPKSFVFSDDGGATHWDLSWPSHAWRNYADKAGLEGVRLHDLRHTAASQMLMAGIPISIVAERLGCTEANILRTYRHFIPGSDKAAAALMDRMMNGEAIDAT